MNERPAPPQKRVTVVDVARAAGVSPGTVSNSISGKRKVDDATRARIEDAIRQLGYVPNLAARRMRTGRTNTIAIFSSMPFAVAAGSSKLGFLMEIAASAAVTALEYNSALALIPPIDDPARAFETIAMDGAVIVEPEANDPILDQLLRRGVPAVAIGAPVGVDVPSIDFDYHQMAHLLIDHLFDVGAQHFPLVIGQSSRRTNTVFAEVYQDRATKAGMPARILEVPERNAEQAAADAISAELSRGADFDGVLVPIDAMASGVLAAVKASGRRVPQDARIVTRYDGLRARTAQPPITALNLHLEEVAQRAVHALCTIIDTGETPATTPVPNPDLVIRESSVPTT